MYMWCGPYFATICTFSYGGMELLRPGSSNSGGLASPRSDTSYDVITTGTEARHNGTSPAQPQLYSGDNTMKVYMENMCIIL